MWIFTKRKWINFFCVCPTVNFECGQNVDWNETQKKVMPPHFAHILIKNWATEFIFLTMCNYSFENVRIKNCVNSLSQLTAKENKCLFKCSKMCEHNLSNEISNFPILSLSLCVRYISEWMHSSREIWRVFFYFKLYLKYIWNKIFSSSSFLRSRSSLSPIPCCLVTPACSGQHQWNSKIQQVFKSHEDAEKNWETRNIAQCSQTRLCNATLNRGKTWNNQE